jgi:hypothetical protein
LAEPIVNEAVAGPHYPVATLHLVEMSHGLIVLLALDRRQRSSDHAKNVPELDSSLSVAFSEAKNHSLSAA